MKKPLNLNVNHFALFARTRTACVLRVVTCPSVSLLTIPCERKSLFVTVYDILVDGRRKV